jgi:hypothetical protein
MFSMTVPKITVFLLAVLVLASVARGESYAPSLPPHANDLVRQVVQNEVRSQTADHTHWMYRVRHEEAGKSEVKEIVQTSHGTLSRLVEENGHALAAEEQKREDERIRKLVKDPGQLKKLEAERRHDSEQAESMLQMLPDAMIFSYAGGSDDISHAGDQNDVVRLNFRPNPHYDPRTREATVFHHMAGTMWVNARERRLVRLDGKLIAPVKFGAGLLGHLDEGGTFSVHDTEIAPGIWDMTYLQVNMHGKALFFHTIAVTEKEIHDDYRRVPQSISLEEAASLLTHTDVHLAQMTK